MDLVILAAGMGSRFGGAKQIKPVDDEGRFIIDYSIRDAIAAGFDHIILIIREKDHELFKNTVGKRIPEGIKVDYVFQEMQTIPNENIPAERTKPLGTAHAILCCENTVENHFLIINADDYYGPESYKLAYNFQCDDGNFGCITYEAGNTLTQNGSVKRGVCEIKDDKIVKITESSLINIDGIIKSTPLDGTTDIEISENTPVSMNMFILPKSIFKELNKGFIEFMDGINNPFSDEYLIPDVINGMLKYENISVTNIKSKEKWHGITYPKDLDRIKNYISKMRNSMKGPEYIVVQAGGKGTRLKHLTTNKPKAIVSVNNLPMIFHLFKKYPESRFIIIGDYKKNVLDNYLDAFCKVKYITVGTGGFEGTCSGIKNALNYIPNNTEFMLIWSDLILEENENIPLGENTIGISGSFQCRWSYIEDKFEEIPSVENGVAGLFIFQNKKIIENVPLNGEFVRWLQSQNMMFNTYTLKATGEYGLIDSINESKSGKCRPFNKMTIIGNILIKEGIDQQGMKLAEREVKWYKHVSKFNIPIPKIYEYEPLKMELIDGNNPFVYDLSENEKKIALFNIMKALKTLHTHDVTTVDKHSMYENYFNKTFDRINGVRNLIPFANDEYIIINNRKCHNVFFIIDKLRDMIDNIQCESFCLIHGDCTFSNIIMKNKSEPIFIDPRGYFGHQEIVGDPNYDWAKLYYSLIGDYDQFNLGKFRLTIKDDEVALEIQSNEWKCLYEDFVDNLPINIKIDDIKLLHSMIWLSLTTYAWDDYDSICASFYNGIYYLEELL